MLTLLILAALVTAPWALLLSSQPEIALMTKPKNLGLLETDLLRPVSMTRTVDAINVLAHRVPSGMSSIRKSELTSR
jgi:hypothetical protein